MMKIELKGLRIVRVCSAYVISDQAKAEQGSIFFLLNEGGLEN